MNYQFTRNELGVPSAQFEMGSEAFSRLFSDELGANEPTIAEVCAAIADLEAGTIKQFTWQGREFRLSLDLDEAEVRSKVLDLDGYDELPEGTELYDQEFIAGCGFDDFKKVLTSWREFVAET